MRCIRSSIVRCRAVIEPGIASASERAAVVTASSMAA